VPYPGDGRVLGPAQVKNHMEFLRSAVRTAQRLDKPVRPRQAAFTALADPHVFTGPSPVPSVWPRKMIVHGGTVSDRADTIDELKSALGDLVTTVEELLVESVVDSDCHALLRIRAALQEARDAAETLADPEDQPS
jgi:hypothetical protein